MIQRHCARIENRSTPNTMQPRGGIAVDTGMHSGLRLPTPGQPRMYRLYETPRERLAARSWQLGERTEIHQGFSGRYHASEPGALSLKTFFGGPAWYSVGPGRYLVPEGRYLVLNEHQPYEITKDSPSPVESFILFYKDGAAGEVVRSLQARQETLLAEPFQPAPAPHFFERTFALDGELAVRLYRLRSHMLMGTIDPEALPEMTQGILEALVTQQFALRSELGELAALRPATREELYRRLHRAREFIEAGLNEEINLDQLAQVACLSKSHLIRTFAMLFRATPHQYLTQQRIARARQLLEKTHQSVSSICTGLGFRSLGSFSSLFKTHVGLSPAQYRRCMK